MRIVLLTIGVLAVGSASASAEQADLAPRPRVSDNVRVGTMLPLVQSPGTTGSVLTLSSAYDSARHRPLAAVQGQLELHPLVAIAASVNLQAEQFSPSVALQLQLVDRHQHHVDVQLAPGWIDHGINPVEAGFIELDVGSRRGGAYTFATSRFEFGISDNALGAGLGVGSIYKVSPAVFAGVNGALSLDLTPGPDPMNESTWSMHAGPAVTYVIDRYAVTASGGLAADSLRVGPRETGSFGSVGIGTAF